MFMERQSARGNWELSRSVFMAEKTLCHGGSTDDVSAASDKRARDPGHCVTHNALRAMQDIDALQHDTFTVARVRSDYLPF